MGTGIRYSDEFKQEAVNQVVIHGYSVADVSKRLGISTKSLYDWIKVFSKAPRVRESEQDMKAEIARLKGSCGRTDKFDKFARETEK